MISSLSTDVLFHIFSYNDFETQVNISKVSQEWRKASVHPFLAYGKIFSIIKMAHAQPRVSTLLSQKGPFCFRAETRELTFLTTQKPTRELFIINNESKNVTKHNISKWHTKSEHIASVFALSSESFITVTNKGTVAAWQIKNKKIICTNTLRIEDTAPIPQNQLGTISRLSKALIAYKWFNFDYNLTTRERFAQPNLIGGTRSSQPINNKVESSFSHCVNEGTVYRINWEQHLASYSLDETNTLVKRFQIPLSLDEVKKPPQPWMYRENSWEKVIGVNSQWVVVAQHFDIEHQEDELHHTIQKTLTFHVCDLTTHQEVLKFQENCGHLARKFAWLCDDFLVVLLNKELRIWHLPTKSFLTQIPLEGIIKLKDLQNSNLGYCPILNVSIKAHELQVLYQESTGTVQIAKFGLKDPESLLALDRAQKNPSRKLEQQKDLCERISYTVKMIFREALSKIQNLFNYQ